MLYNDDCLKVLPILADNSVDLVLADPPYGTSACEWDNVIPYKEVWSNLKRVIKKNRPIILFGVEPFSSYLRMSNIDWFKYDWIWEKQRGSNFLNYKYQPSKNYEIASLFSEGATSYTGKDNNCPYFPQMVSGKAYQQKQGKCGDAVVRAGSRDNKNIITKNEGTRYPNAIQKFNSDKDKFHPTQKPVALLEYLLNTYTNKNDTVLDFTMGSGSTGVACKNINRNFIGIEMDKNYFDIAKNRIEGTLI